MNGKKFKGQRIEVEFSKKTIPEVSSCLIVFGLSDDTIERELKEEFSRFGPLEKFYIMRGNTGRSRQSYEIKSPPWIILWFRSLEIFSVENIARLGVFLFQTSDNSQLCIDSQYSSQ